MNSNSTRFGDELQCIHTKQRKPITNDIRTHERAQARATVTANESANKISTANINDDKIH